jgi:hypothetical protein
VQLAGANHPTRATVGGTAINMINPQNDNRKKVIGGETRLYIYRVYKKNGAVSIVFTIETSPFFCVYPVFI